jgi:hypothetical protein
MQGNYMLLHRRTMAFEAHPTTDEILGEPGDLSSQASSVNMCCSGLRKAAWTMEYEGRQIFKSF